jgi:hypothetical protein
MVCGCAHAPFVEASFTSRTEASIKFAWNAYDIDSSNARTAVADKDTRWWAEERFDRHHVAPARFDSKYFGCVIAAVAAVCTDRGTRRIKHKFRPVICGNLKDRKKQVAAGIGA